MFVSAWGSLLFCLERELVDRRLPRFFPQRRTAAIAAIRLADFASGWMSARYNAKIENTFIQDRQRDVRAFHCITLTKRTDYAGTFQTRRDGGLFR